MTVDIKAVLALLPELFPGVQEIPLAAIRPNPDNPGPVLTDKEIQELADNLADRGLVNPIKGMPDKANPLADGVQIHPDNPRLTAAGQPWALSDFRFITLAGERRYRAAGRLGWAAIKGFILNPTEEEAVEITHLDNDVRDRGWWAGYQSIEQLIRANSSLTQRQVGARLKMDPTRVSKALRLLPLLNQTARNLIVGNSYNSNKGIWGISESAALRLADLGPGSTLKPGVRAGGEESQRLWPYPPIPAETQDLVRRTLEKALELELTDAGMQKLVRWVQDGGAPEKYGNEPSQPALAGNGKPKAKAEADPEEDEAKPIEWTDGVKHAEYQDVSVARVRVCFYLDQLYAHSDTNKVDVMARVMERLRFPVEYIKLRPLTEAEKQADPDHDYELFDQFFVFKAAQKLGWPTTRSMIFTKIEQWESIRLFNSIQGGSSPLSWIERYIWLNDRLNEDPNTELAQWSTAFERDKALFEEVRPVLKLINESAMKEICLAAHRCHRDETGYEFTAEHALLLARLESFSKNLAITQILVEKVVRAAIENEMEEDELEELVDWALAGNDPEKFLKPVGELV